MNYFYSLTVVRSFYSLLQVVGVRLSQASGSNAHKLLGFKLLNGSGASVAHRRAQTAHDLVGNLTNFTAVRNLAFHALWHQLIFAAYIRLEVAALRVSTLLTRQPAALHRAHRAHAAVALVLLATDNHDVAGCFQGARKH